MNFRPVVLGIAGLLPLAGCFSGYEVKGPRPSPEGAVSPKAAFDGLKEGEKPVAKAVGGSETPASNATRMPARGHAPAVQLSAGVALPQTLPDGTVMSFSVDYQFAQGQPDANAGYVWVIERSRGAPSRQPVKLSPRGTLQAFVAEFRKEEEPFQTFLEDGRGNRVSQTAPLR